MANNLILDSLKTFVETFHNAAEKAKIAEEKLDRFFTKERDWLQKVNAWRVRYKNHPDYSRNHPDERKFRKMQRKVEDVKKRKRENANKYKLELAKFELLQMIS